MQATLLLILSIILASSADFQLKLSLARCDIASASVGTKVIFAGGLVAAGVATKIVDIYDVNASAWTFANLTVARSAALALTVGTKVLICGGAEGSNVIEIYESLNNTWTTKTLTGTTRSIVKGTVVGTKVYFAGGYSLLGSLLGISDLVDVYDSVANTWTTVPLLVKKLSSAVATVGGRACFIGGIDVDGNALLGINVLDIGTGLWTTVNLTVARTQLAAVSVGADVAVIAGGLVNTTLSNVCEIFNGTVVTAVAVLPEARCLLEAATDGVKAYFIGGVKTFGSLTASARVDIYNILNNTWSLKTLAVARLNISVTNLEKKVFVAGGLVGSLANGVFSDLCEVFEDGTPSFTPTPTPVVTPTPTPSGPVSTPTPTPLPKTLKLSIGRCDIAAAAIGNKVLFAGGLIAAGVATKIVDIYDISTQLWVTANLTVARSAALALTVGTKVLICGGAEGSNVIEIYESLNNTWTTKTLTGTTRSIVKGTVVGTKVYFAGGYSLLGSLLGISDLVDVYDSVANTWTTVPLLVKKLSSAVATVGGKACFIGGIDVDGNALVGINVLDIGTGLWTTVNLTVARTQLAAVSVGADVAVIAGGLVNTVVSDVCEIFNGTVVKAVAVLPVARCQLQAVSDGVRAWFIGGLEAISPIKVSARIDIYNPVTDVWTLKALVSARTNLSVVSIGANVFVAGGLIGDITSGVFSDVCEIFEFIDDVITPDTPTPGVTPTPSPGSTPTRTPTRTPTPSPVVAPTPTPSPTGDGGVACRAACLVRFNTRKGLFAQNPLIDFTEQCGCWSEYRECVAGCDDSDDQTTEVQTQCKAEEHIGDLCDCEGNGYFPTNTLLVSILADLKALFLQVWVNEIAGCRDTDIKDALASALRFTFKVDIEITLLADVSGKLKVVLGKYLNCSPERFLFSDTSSKRSILETLVDGDLTAEVVDPPPPSDGSATGVAYSFVFFMVIALFHLF